MIVIPGSEG